MSMSLSQLELVQLVRKVFRPRPEDRKLALMVDLPDERVADNPDWVARRELITEWYGMLREARGQLGLDEVHLVRYTNVGSNNADLPDQALIHSSTVLTEDEGRVTSFAEILEKHQMIIAATEFSATAPLKLMAPAHGFRAVTMPGFRADMIPALRLDWEEIDERCRTLKGALDRAESAVLRLAAEDVEHELLLDLRHRQATASGGLVRDPGTAGNLPSGETYIVPYEGELPDDGSLSRGTLPVELEGQLMVYRIEGNRVVEVIGDGPRADAERREFKAEPAYANIAELGLGLLADYGVKPVGEILLDEKLGLHVAFGRSDHFGGSVGAKDFTAPNKVIHIDRVYIPEVQPQIRVLAVDLLTPGEESLALIRDGKFVSYGD
jgi:leucyl aminopeptidase (aminopeptidase T)